MRDPRAPVFRSTLRASEGDLGAVGCSPAPPGSPVAGSSLSISILENQKGDLEAPYAFKQRLATLCHVNLSRTASSALELSCSAVAGCDHNRTKRARKASGSRCGTTKPVKIGRAHV